MEKFFRFLNRVGEMVLGAKIPKHRLEQEQEREREREREKRPFLIARSAALPHTLPQKFID